MKTIFSSRYSKQSYPTEGKSSSRVSAQNRCWKAVLSIVVLLLAVLSTTTAQAIDRKEWACLENNPEIACQRNRSIANVLDAFDNLTHTGEWLGFHNNYLAPLRLGLVLTPDLTADPSRWTKAHIQGIARSPRPGFPYIFVSCAGEQGSLFGIPEGNLMVIKMESRNKTGERLRSNRLLTGAETSVTVSPVEDRVVYNITTPGYLGITHLKNGKILLVIGDGQYGALDFVGAAGYYLVVQRIVQGML